MHQDEINKRLFSEPRMIQDLLEAFFDQRFVKELDFGSLTRVNSNFISSNTQSKKRESDIIWKIRWKNNWLHLLLMLEFQSSVDKFMAVRFLSYITLLYEQIIKSDKSMLYRSLDDVKSLADRLTEIFKNSPEASSLIRAFTVYLTNRFETNESTPDIQIDTITEVNTMLRETVQQWKRDFYNEGLDQGRSEGRSEGERTVIERQLIRKFGELMPTYQQKLRQLSEKQLLSISDKILFASNLEQVFAETLMV